MEPIVVKDFDSALEAIKALAQFGEHIVQIPAEGSLVIRLTGEQWDGKLDYKVAEFITRLQREIVALYNISSGTDRRFSSKFVEEFGLRVTVTLEQGSSLIKVVLDELFRNMSPNQKFLSLVIVAAIFGSAYAIPEIWKSNNDKTVAIHEINTKIKNSISEESLNERIQNTVKYSLDHSQCMPYLASQMKPEDKIYINDIELTSDEAKSIYRATVSQDQEMLEKEFFLDMDSEVILRDYSKNSITIQFEKRKRVFYLDRLDDNALQELNKELAKSKNGIVHKIPLRLTGVFKGGVFKRGYVDSVGGPREGAMDIQSASLASASMEEDAEQENAE